MIKLKNYFDKIKIIQNRKRLLAVLGIILLILVFVATIILLNSRNLSSNTKAAAASLNITVGPSTGSIIVGQTQLLNFRATPLAITTDRISGADITITTSGGLQIQSVGSIRAIGNTSSNDFVEISRTIINPTTARIVAVVSGSTANPPANSTLPTELTFQVTVLSTAAGNGSVAIDVTNSQFVGNISTNSYVINSAQTGSYTQTTTTPVTTTIATTTVSTTTVPVSSTTASTITKTPICSSPPICKLNETSTTITPTGGSTCVTYTCTPINATTAITTTLVPTTQITTTVNPGCLCGGNGMCSTSCSFANSANPTSVRCSRSSITGVADQTQTDKNAVCTRSYVNQGDADGLGTVDPTTGKTQYVTYTDYLWYLRYVTGGSIPSNIFPDFNGDGTVDRSDLNIVTGTIAAGL